MYQDLGTGKIAQVKKCSIGNHVVANALLFLYLVLVSPVWCVLCGAFLLVDAALA